ncbi:hypothetical protein [Arthrobacter sp. H5]|uniref:hypothetical protein n=1 Tax=Arthrobacter sp. H5 TaxID=1267973 RepID=UPI0004AD33F0|nr:hypothetical protein [Arthrobacter sp. H5]
MAVLAALHVLIRGDRVAYVVAAVVGLPASAAVVLYRYVQVPAIGPIQSMYEPVWYGKRPSPQWQKPPPGSSPSLATHSYTGAAITGKPLRHTVW